MLRHAREVALGLFILGLALGAQAGPAMFTGSFIWEAFGNDISSGTQSPYNTTSFTFEAIPIGHDCQDALPSTPNGILNTRYCSPTLRMIGAPATGSGYLVSGGATLGGPIGLAQSTIAIVTTGFNATYYPYIQSNTSANFVNEAGTFFAGGGAAAGQGQLTKTGMGQRSGTWIIHEGARGFGGTMGLLGFFGAKRQKYVVPGKVGTYTNSPSDWNMIKPLGRPQFATVYSYTPMGKTNWMNPHQLTDSAINNVNSNVSQWIVYATGSPWTTGSVTLYAKAGVFPTILHRAGYDTVTSGGVRNIQLVTPELTHWIGPGFQSHTGQMGILKLQITPEPRAVLLLAAGGGLLALLYGANRRRERD